MKQIRGRSPPTADQTQSVRPPASRREAESRHAPCADRTRPTNSPGSAPDNPGASTEPPPATDQPATRDAVPVRTNSMSRRPDCARLRRASERCARRDATAGPTATRCESRKSTRDPVLAIAADYDGITRSPGFPATRLTHPPRLPANRCTASTPPLYLCRGLDVAGSLARCLLTAGTKGVTKQDVESPGEHLRCAGPAVSRVWHRKSQVNRLVQDEIAGVATLMKLAGARAGIACGDDPTPAGSAGTPIGLAANCGKLRMKSLDRVQSPNSSHCSSTELPSGST